MNEEKILTKREKIIDKLIDIMFFVVPVVIVVVLALVSISTVKSCQNFAVAADDFNSSIVAISEIADGTVVDKKIERTGFFTKQPAYYLYIAGEYTRNDGEVAEWTVKMIVDKETYLKYDIGDYFDSRNP